MTPQSLIIDSGGGPQKAPADQGQAQMLGVSPAMQKVRHLAMKVAPTDSNVLITGETGTGKEMLARAIHASSPRRDRPFVAVNASAIPENLQESEFFGHKKGSFTGAVSDRRGLFEEAAGGTLFLDEIGDCSIGLQVKLLRALENRVIRRVGDSAERPVDVRVIAATNKDLAEQIAKGEFREDLFFRLNVVHLHLPPLRERGEDVEAFLLAFLRRHAARQGKPQLAFSKDALTLLKAYAFPGNIRELENVVHHAVLMADGEEIRAVDLPPYLFNLPRLSGPAASVRVLEESLGATLELGDGFMTFAEMEKALIQATLDKLKGNQSTAAKKLGVSRSTLWRKMKEYGIPA